MPRESYPHELIIRGTDRTAKYNLKVEGGSFVKDDKIEADDKLYNNNKRAAGIVQEGGEDIFRFGGTIVVCGVGLSGDAEFEINDKVYQSDELPKQWQIDAGVYDDFAGNDETPHGDTDGGVLDTINAALSGENKEGDSDLQKALDREFEKARKDAPKERHSKVTLESTQLTTLPHTLQLNRNQTLDLNGSDLTTTGSFNAVRFDRNSRLENGGFDAASVENEQWYDAVALVFDPMNMGIDPKVRNGEYVDKDSWRPRDPDDPDNKHRNHVVRQQNLSGTGTAVHNFDMKGKPADNSTMVKFEQSSSPDGWICSSIDMMTVEMTAEDVGYPVIINSETGHGGGYINDIEVRGYASGWKVGEIITGEAIARKNDLNLDLQPDGGISEIQVIIDNPKAEANGFVGTMWDIHRNSTGMVAKCDRASGMNVITDKTKSHGNDDRIGDEAEKVNIIKPPGF